MLKVLRQRYDVVGHPCAANEEAARRETVQATVVAVMDPPFYAQLDLKTVTVNMIVRLLNEMSLAYVGNPHDFRQSDISHRNRP